MGQTFTSTTESVEQMQADLGTVVVADSDDTPVGAAAVQATDEPAPAVEPAVEPAKEPEPKQTETPAIDVAIADLKAKIAALSDEERDKVLAEPTIKRVAKLTRKLRDAEAERDELRAAKQTEPTKSEPKPAEAKPAPVAEDPEPQEPDPSKFEDYDALETARRKHVKDYAAWAAREAVRQDRAKRDAEQTERQRTEQANAEAETLSKGTQAFQERMEALLAEQPDADDVIDDDENAFPLAETDLRTQTLRRMVLTSTDAQGKALGPDILLYLAQHPDERTALAKITVFGDFVRAVGRLEARVEGARTKPAKPQPKVSSAPAPIARVAGASSAATSLTDLGADDSENYAEWERNRQAQLRARGSGRR